MACSCAASDSSRSLRARSSGASSAISATHQYGSAGIYDITLLLTDDDGGTAGATCGFVVIFDPDGGFVNGGGHVQSPAGAQAADPQAAGHASFGYVSKHKKSASKPTGSTEFELAAGDLDFHSSDYQWLVVSGNKAQFKGTGTINRVDGYGFMLTATDGSPDTFRIKVWRTSDGSVVYDNQAGSPDTTEPTTALRVVGPPSAGVARPRAPRSAPRRRRRGGAHARRPARVRAPSPRCRSAQENPVRLL